MAESNKALVQKFYAAIGAGDIDTIASLIHDDMVEHDEFPGLEQSKAGALAFFRSMRAAFPDLTFIAEEIIEEGDLIAVRGAMRGTHKGEFLGVAPTNKTITVPMADFVRVRDGKAVEHWGVTDTGVMMEQLTGG